nr:MAG TPA: YopX protein [Caudoviricetes sp.]
MIPRFRAWYVLAEEMIDEILMISFVRKEIIGKFSDGSTSVPLKFEDERNGEDVVLMQSTGLHDKNGKEIFEGDIVKRYRSPFFKAEWEYRIEIVIKEEARLLLGRKYGKNFWTIPFHSPFAKSDLLEVIGNIYENKELLDA